MKYQFTTEGSKSQTRYYIVSLFGPTAEEGLLFQNIVSTPLLEEELECFIDNRLLGDILSSFHYQVRECTAKPSTCIGLDSLARIISNIKPLKQKVVISICGEKKTYELDAEKLETLLKSLE